MNDLAKEKKAKEEIINEEEIVEEKLTPPAEDFEKKFLELEEKYLRLAAEYKNYQARTQREKDELYSRSVADTVEKLLPIVDSVERAETMGKDAKSASDVYEGIELINKMTKEVFEKLGVEPILAVGEKFDANFHNAVMHIDDENYGENEICEEFVKGYKTKDRVIRYSMVKVAN